jgi:hypothetical protein
VAASGGTTLGIDIDPNDGNVWAYERCGAGTAGGGPVDRDNTPLDPDLQVRSKDRRRVSRTLARA